MRIIVKMLQTLSIAALVTAVFPDAVYLYRQAGFMEEFSQPRSFEAVNWKRKIAEMNKLFKDLIDDDILKGEEHIERSHAAKSAFKLVFLERLMWYYPDQDLRKEADHAINTCSNLINRMDAMLLSQQEDSKHVLQYEDLSDSQKAVIASSERKLERMRVSLLRSFYDTYWRMECALVIEDYALKVDFIENSFESNRIDPSARPIKLKALMTIVDGLISWIRPEPTSCKPEHELYHALLYNMRYDTRNILSNMKLILEMTSEERRIKISALATETEHLAAKFFYSEFPPIPLQQDVALRIWAIFKNLRTMGHYSSDDERQDFQREPHSHRLLGHALKALFAKGIVAKLITLIFENIYRTLNDVWSTEASPLSNQPSIMEEWMSTADSLIQDYEAWGLGDSVFSSRIYEIYKTILEASETSNKFCRA
ncbi:hypothetical protein JCM33374_g4473 [Metschnikowia sp. JCM 33374]|nr:hypothetical protein JCM33374_g4473 [Metschnikowia sp. JCM 33374]